MPSERSNPSEITGEKAARSKVRSISLATCWRPFCTTTSVTGSTAAMDRSGGGGSAPRGVEVERHAVVVLEHGLGVHVGEVQHAHVGVGLLHPRSPEPDVPDRGDDTGEEARAELAHLVGGERRVDALFDGQPQPLPHLALIEAVAHVITGLDDELLALVALGV